ncbi:MAG TPA: 2-oxo acid dehydrogenase subunit E2 [Ktedonobacteraceae bacterium]|nr:2-oxo acid dehydrogenase subunit E2 [Ktedonobacteraceae bacterium]
MATNVILPALGMAQDTGKIVRWLKTEGEEVVKGEPVAEIETDKATVELEAPATGRLVNILAKEGVEVPVGHVIATILAADELPHSENSPALQPASDSHPADNGNSDSQTGAGSARSTSVLASPLAARIAAEHHLDLTEVKAVGRRISKADVLSHIQQQQAPTAEIQPRLLPASPKARRLANERNLKLKNIMGSGPGGAVLTADVLAATIPATPDIAGTGPEVEEQRPAVSTTWRIMAERTTQSWTTTPHFYLVREVNASRLIAWREHIQRRSSTRITYTDLLVKIVAASLRDHPRLNVSWQNGTIIQHHEIHIGLAVATQDGLVVPVIHHAGILTIQQIAQARAELAEKAQAGKLRLPDISNGTFTISNLGMYGVDAFNAVINTPQAAILAVGRIAERVVPVHGQPAVQPMMTLTLTCDHRATDGARAAQFLDGVATLIEEPLGLLG